MSMQANFGVYRLSRCRQTLECIVYVDAGIDADNALHITILH